MHDEDYDDDVAIAPLDLRRMFAVVRRHLGLVVICTVLAAAAAAAYAKLRTPSFTATAVIRLRDTRGQISGGLATDGADVLGGPEVSPLLSLVELLSSRTMAGNVVDSLPLLRLQSDNLPLDLVRALRVGSRTHWGMTASWWPSRSRPELTAPLFISCPGTTPSGRCCST